MDITPEVKKLFSDLQVKLKKFGPIIIEEKKTSFHIKNKSSFAGVHPRKNYFILNIVSSTPIKSPKLMKQEQVSKNRFHNEIKIEKIEDMSSEVINWLKNAYALTA